MAGLKMIKLPNSKREPVKGARLVGDVDANEIIDVTVRVRRGKGKALLPETLAALGATPHAERKHMTREEFAAAHGADHSDIEKVVQYASEHGLTAHDPSIARRSVHLSGTAQAMTEAFGVDLKHYQVDNTLTYRGNADHVHVPEEISDVVEAIVGFDNRPCLLYTSDAADE